MFQSGARCGLLPAQLLELNLAQFQAVVDGYSDRLQDNFEHAVWAGYFSAYYQSKHPKSPQQIIEQSLMKRSNRKLRNTQSVDIDDAIAKFQERDVAFALAELNNKSGV